MNILERGRLFEGKEGLRRLLIVVDSEYECSIISIYIRYVNKYIIRKKVVVILVKDWYNVVLYWINNIIT